VLGVDLTVRLIKPQFWLGFTNAILVINVDGATALQSTYKFGRSVATWPLCFDVKDKAFDYAPNVLK